MKAIYEYDVGKEHQAISVFHKLIALELTTWLPVITLLFYRIASIEQLLDKDADRLLFRLEHFADDEKHRNSGGSNQRLLSVLAELPTWYFHVASAKYHWNPLEEPLQDFTARHGCITVFESPDPILEPTLVIDWLTQLHDCLQTQDPNALVF